MLVDMAERIRLIIDTEDVLRRAVHLRRLKMPAGTTVSDVVNGILRAALANEVEEIQSFGEIGGEAPRPKRKRKDGGE
jgi:hypothetical protein